MTTTAAEVAQRARSVILKAFISRLTPFKERLELGRHCDRVVTTGPDASVMRLPLLISIIIFLTTEDGGH